MVTLRMDGYQNPFNRGYRIMLGGPKKGCSGVVGFKVEWRLFG